MGTQIAEDLAHPVHAEQARQLLEGDDSSQGIEPGDYELDVITFVVRALPEDVAAILTLMDEGPVLTVPQVEALFGAST